MTVFPPDDIRILYKNHRGETSWRRVRPSHIWYGRTEYHPIPQWLLSGYDLDKEAGRDFAMSDIVAWKNASNAAVTGENRKFGQWLLEYREEFGQEIYQMLLQVSERGKFEYKLISREGFEGIAKNLQSFLLSIDQMISKS